MRHKTKKNQFWHESLPYNDEINLEKNLHDSCVILTFAISSAWMLFLADVFMLGFGRLSFSITDPVLDDWNLRHDTVSTIEEITSIYI